MKLTDEQIEIIKVNFANILLINAFAGTGKTTTLVEFCKERKDKKILYLAYNKGLGEEAVIKFKDLPNVKVSTIHSLAYRDIGYKYKLRLGNLRPYDIAPFFEGKVNDSIKYYYAFYSLIILRNFLNSEYTLDEFKKILEFTIGDILVGYTEYNTDILIEQFNIIWNSILESDSIIIEHDFYLKLYQLSNPDLSDYNFILIDESQDINGVMLDLILKQNTKKVFIGDSYQQIYSWRGTKNTFQILGKEKDKVELFLTNSFRCYKYNSNLANQYLKILGATKDFKGLNRKRTNFDNITILGRTNGYLMNYIIANKGKIFYIGGFDSYRFNLLLDLDYLYKGKNNKIKDSFIKLFPTLADLEYYADQAKEKNIQSMLKLVKDINAGEVNIKELRGVEDIEELVMLLDKEQTNDYIYCDYCISTTHKAKGLEWDNVKLLNDFIQLKNLEDEGFKKLNLEEINILYVAITRAKQKLMLSNNYELSDEDVEIIKKKLNIKGDNILKKQLDYIKENIIVDYKEKKIEKVEKETINILNDNVIVEEIKLLHEKGKNIKEIASELGKTEADILEYITKMYSLN